MGRENQFQHAVTRVPFPQNQPHCRKLRLPPRDLPAAGVWLGGGEACFAGGQIRERTGMLSRARLASRPTRVPRGISVILGCAQSSSRFLFLLNLAGLVWSRLGKKLLGLFYLNWHPGGGKGDPERVNGTQ